MLALRITADSATAISQNGAYIDQYIAKQTCDTLILYQNYALLKEDRYSNCVQFVPLLYYEETAYKNKIKQNLKCFQPPEIAQSNYVVGTTVR